jgi:hypothetical protein
VPSISTPLIVLAALAVVPAVVLVSWVGLLFHQVLKLPADQQRHGVTVLKQLTEFVRVGFMRRSADAKASQGRLRLPMGSQDDGRS